MKLILASGEGFVPPGLEDFWQPLFGTDGNWAITRPSILMLLSVLLISIWLIRATRKLAMVPGKGQFFAESVYNFVRDGVAKDVIGSRQFLRFVPLLFSMFLLIAVNNLFGIIPFIQYPTMARFGFPFALAMIIFFVYHVVGIREMGFSGYFKHMVPPGLPKAMILPIFILEIITYFFTRPVTLSLRLFGNMFAGHILLLLTAVGTEHLLFADGFGLKLAGVGTFIGAVALTFFEAFVELLQAYVFTLLAAMYIAGSVVADDH